MRTFARQRTIRFSQCDVAGIVFYPRFVEMLNDLVEDWFATGIGVSFRALHADRKLGVPTARLEIDFLKPCELGEELLLNLRVLKLGRSSIHAEIRGSTEAQERFRALLVIVCADLATRKSVELPADMRAKMKLFLTP